MTPPALVLEHVSKSYNTHRALDDVSVVVERGSCLALVGESGSGKTTLLRCINRLVEIDAGRVMVEGRDVREVDAVELRRSIGYVPQEGGLLPHWRVRRNVALVPWLEGDARSAERADEALALVGLAAQGREDLAHRWPHELSGGQRQRVAVARALAGGQSVLLLDEPFGALDAITRSDLQRMLLDLRTRTERTIVLVTHDLHEAVRLADRVAVLYRGRVEQIATPDALESEPATPYVAELIARSELGHA
jgi:osmoprotectant transport system ATP-binding protein